ncbi:MAG: phosphoglycerate dehydrogenase [Tessaracoccus sp.]|uniref:NAD(P)-dependent oxidoreductase n=1 Tax=Tessaracoccus sp. TaxID=1971211 RepID=UPI001EB8D0FC|nr:NAD(P)-dependent oxidoreductase [Tessaracoccus sp.]MBK7821946.1 phosphoglycerate dehydrogenase [Tessaracoccus sp.]
MKVLVPDTYKGALPVIEGVEIVVLPARELVPEEHIDADVFVAWAQPEEVLRDAAARMKDLRLVQGFQAGPDGVLAAGFDPRVPICSGVGLHDGPVAEHALGLTIALLRNLPLALARQAERQWDGRLGGTLRPRAYDGRVTTLDGANVVIWGFGSIAATLAPLLTALGAHVTGAARTAGERHGYPVVDDAGLAEILPTTDILIMILPHSTETAAALNADRLAQLRQGALVVNVGRGTTIDEEALVAALESGHVAGAALDVTAVEPLPADSPLWSAPNLILTPHTAGGRPRGADVFLANQIAALRADRPLRNFIPR